ncbi:hypothetical protein N5D44_05780 [Acinetobacter junii]|uniref:hypothetical protein n=1 Tax=Acinetobacter junii TaxID=40215 RepID=UPI00244BB7DF|nr:hypothetical protein [Acinetobacter junii]MDH1857852.1 hypothetical protein [Acinetobacter junii]
MNFNKKIRIENIDFIEQLKNLYLDIKISVSGKGQLLNFHDALNVYKLLDGVMPVLVSSYDGSDEELDKYFEDEQVEKLISAIKNVKFFPNTNLYKINPNYFYEYRTFLEFTSRVRSQKTIKVANGMILLFDETKGCWNFSEGNHAKEFLKAYISERYRNRLKVSNSSKSNKSLNDEQDKEFEKVQLKFEQDTTSLLTTRGMLYVVAAKVSFKDLIGEPEKFKMSSEVRNILIGHLANTESVVQIYYLPFYNTHNRSDYFVIFLIQSPIPVDEEYFISQTKSELEKAIVLLEKKNLMLGVDCQNLNDKFRQTTLTSFQENKFVLAKGAHAANEVVNKWFFDFLYQLERFGSLSDQHISPTKFTELYLDRGHSKSKFLETTSIINLKPQLFQTLFTLDLTARIKQIWKLDHLSPQAQTYIQQVSMIYREQFAVWDVEHYFDLATQIEIFIMSLRENPYDAFSPMLEVTRKRARQVIDFERTITRQLLQFCEIFKNRIDLDNLQQTLKNLTVTRTLNFFFKIYQSQKQDYRISGTLDLFLGQDIGNERFRNKLDKLVGEYKFKQPIFYGSDIFKQKLTTKNQRKPMDECHDVHQLSEVLELISSDKLVDGAEERLNIENQDDSFVVQLDKQDIVKLPEKKELPRNFNDQSYRLIHIQRHGSRLEKVQMILKNAMKTDVVILRCLFSCKSSTALEHGEISRIFSRMLQANKKTAPFSSITAYLGYWEGVKRTSDGKSIKEYAANVIFIFKVQVLIDYPDLLRAINHAWRITCKQHEQYSLESIVGNVQDLSLAHSIERLNCKQLSVDTTDRKLVKNIIQHFSNFVVYQDLLDDPLYSEIPKWLIKKNGSSSVLRKSS